VSRRQWLVSILLACCSAGLADGARAQEWPEPDRETVRQYIVQRANHYGYAASSALAIAECESHLDPAAYNRVSGATGVYQWVRGGIWSSTPAAAELGISIWNEYAAGNRGAWLLDVDQGVLMLASGYRSHWSC
jgi:hypothetical protein